MHICNAFSELYHCFIKFSSPCISLHFLQVSLKNFFFVSSLCVLVSTLVSNLCVDYCPQGLLKLGFLLMFESADCISEPGM